MRKLNIIINSENETEKGDSKRRLVIEQKREKESILVKINGNIMDQESTIINFKVL